MEQPKIPTEIEYNPSEEAQGVANTSFNAFWSLVPDNDCDVYLISSHGLYDFPDSKQPQEHRYSYVIPENTFVIETLDVGRLCTTTIDKPLWNLLQPVNKGKFIELLKTKTVLHAGSDELKGIVNFSNRLIEPQEYIDVLKNFIIYLPKMAAPKRNVLFGGDIFYEEIPVVPEAAANEANNGENGEAKGKAKRKTKGKAKAKAPQTRKEMHYKLSYRGFGVYRFLKRSAEASAAGAPFPKATNVVKSQHPNLDLTNIKTYFNTSNIFEKLLKTKGQTNESIVGKIATDKTPRIFIFSSCGEYAESSDEKRRTTAMRAIQLQRNAIYNSYNAGHRQFLFRKPISCDLVLGKFLDFMLEKGNNSAPALSSENVMQLAEVGLPPNWVPKNKLNKNAAPGQHYRSIYFPKREVYESKYMFDPQDFEINMYKDMMTPLELIAFDNTLTEEKRKSSMEAELTFLNDNRQLYLDFLNHRAEVWFENMQLFLDGQFNEAYIASLNKQIAQLETELQTMVKNSPEHNEKAQELQDLKDINESMLLYIQMICWTTYLAGKIHEGEENALVDTFKLFLTHVLAERKEKANAKAAAKAAANAAAAEEAAGKGGARKTQRRPRKNLKRRRQSKRQYRGHN